MRKTVVLLASMAFAVLLAGGVALAYIPSGALAAPPKPLYPNLKTVKPTDLTFGKKGGHQLLRFSNTVWNAGQGPLDLRGRTVTTSTGKKKTKVFQRIYDSAGNHKTTKALGLFVYHPSHNHFHFGDFAEYQLWTREAYERWESMGRDDQERFEEKGTKTTFCVMDTQRWKNLSNSPGRAVYNACGEKRQGLSVGWADTYGRDLAGQYIDLGTGRLPDGDYVLRSVADPNNRLYESPNRRPGHWRESRVKNAAATFFTVRNGVIEVTSL